MSSAVDDLPIWAGRQAFYMSSGRSVDDRRRGDALCTAVSQVVGTSALGLTVESWFDEQTPGAISTVIAERILAAPVVFADLTGNSSSVYYEVGVAHGAGVPVICFQTENEQTAFDLADQRTIPVLFEHEELKDAPGVRDALHRAVQRVVRPSDVPATAVGVVRMARALGQAEDEVAALREEVNRRATADVQGQASPPGDVVELASVIMTLAHEGKLELASPETLEAGRRVVDLHEGVGSVVDTREGQQMTARIRFRNGVTRTLEVTGRTRLYLLPWGAWPSV